MTTPGQTPRTDAEWALSVEKRLRALQNPTAARIGDFVIAQRGGQLVAQRPGQQPFALSGANLEQLATTIAGQQAAGTPSGTGAGGSTPTTPTTPSPLDPLENLIDQALDSLGLDAVGGLVDKIFDLADELGSWLGNTEDTHAGLGNLASAVFEGINDFVPDLGFSDLLDQIRNLFIPSTKVAGVGGPGNIGDTARATWNQLIGGMVDTPGTDAGLADMYTIPNLISSWASLGRMGFEILGIRGNKSLFNGFGRSSTSNLRMDALAFNKNTSGTATTPTVPTTSAAALTSWHVIAEAIDIGTVGWTGSGVAGLTSFFVNLWKMDPATGDIAVVHHSANQVGLLSATMADYDYDLPSSVHFDPGELLGIELHPIGGTHNVVGDVTWRNFNANTLPRRWSSKRNAGSGTGTPSAVVNASVDYTTTNVPFSSYGVSSGAVPLPHQPQPLMFATPGATSIPIPSWANFVDVVVLPGAGGGHQGGTWGVAGQGGDPGAWAHGTWARGTDFTGSPSISITVGNGGAGGGGNGGDGGATTVSITGHSVTTPGGSGATGLTVAGSSAIHGHSPGPHTYLGVLYVGGGEQQTTGADGVAPGGGGAGGNAATFSSGGDGAPGVVYLVFRQS